MQVASADHGLDMLDRFDTVVDQDAEPVDLDEVLAEFLLTYVERTHSTSADPPATESSISTTGDKGFCNVAI